MFGEQKKGTKNKDSMSGYHITLGPANAMVQPKTIILNLKKSIKGETHDKRKG